MENVLIFPLKLHLPKADISLLTQSKYHIGFADISPVRSTDITAPLLVAQRRWVTQWIMATVFLKGVI